MSKRYVRFIDPGIIVQPAGSKGGDPSGTSSYAETASFAHTASYALEALSASYAISASHEIVKEVSSSYADTASFALTASYAENVQNIFTPISSLIARADRNIEITGSLKTTKPITTSGNVYIKHNGAFVSNGTAALFLGTTHQGMDLARLNDSSLVLGGVTQEYGWRIFGIKHGLNGSTYTTEIDNLIATGSMKISGSLDISLESGSAFTVTETDKDQKSRLDFFFDDGDPTLEIEGRSAVAKIVLSNNDGVSNNIKIQSDGQVYSSGPYAEYTGSIKFIPGGIEAVTVGIGGQPSIGSSTRPFYNYHMSQVGGQFISQGAHSKQQFILNSSPTGIQRNDGLYNATSGMRFVVSGSEVSGADGYLRNPNNVYFQIQDNSTGTGNNSSIPFRICKSGSLAINLNQSKGFGFAQYYTASAMVHVEAEPNYNLSLFQGNDITGSKVFEVDREGVITTKQIGITSSAGIGFGFPGGGNETSDVNIFTDVPGEINFFNSGVKAMGINSLNPQGQGTIFIDPAYSFENFQVNHITASSISTTSSAGIGFGTFGGGNEDTDINIFTNVDGEISFIKNNQHVLDILGNNKVRISSSYSLHIDGGSITASTGISSSGDLYVRDGRFQRSSSHAEVEVIGTDGYGLVGTHTNDNFVLRRFNIPKLTISESRIFSHQKIDVQGQVSASTYLGDGSQLTGIDTGSWNGQFSGSAGITGSLLVSGSLEVQSGTSRMYFESGSSAGSNDGKILIKSTGGPSNISLWRTDGVQAALLTGTGGTGFYFSNTGYFGIQPTLNPAVQTSFQGASAFYMDGATGNVGINTNNPLNKFYVRGKIGTNSDIIATGSITSSGLDVSGSAVITGSLDVSGSDMRIGVYDTGLGDSFNIGSTTQDIFISAKVNGTASLNSTFGVTKIDSAVGRVQLGELANTIELFTTTTISGDTTISGSLTLSGSLLNTGTVSIDHTDSPYTITETKQFILIDPLVASVTVNLPTASAYPGRQIFFKLTQPATPNIVTLQCQGADTIDGLSTYTDLDQQFEAISIVSNGNTGWFIF